MPPVPTSVGPGGRETLGKSCPGAHSTIWRGIRVPLAGDGHRGVQQKEARLFLPCEQQLLRLLVLKQVHHDISVSSKAMSIRNLFAARLAQHSDRTTLTTQEVQRAVHLLLPGDLARHTISEGTKAATKFTSSK
ncbi:unnamed protein product [Nyctereutes procyonoides]|uniref:(raccoon dog) hypothetical protein n=1 Tax=Nyctereutes procyonoides TaxID=34880 RepID=A0A811Y0K4_NYCPR|nr:unnamed protein product [Nyctereutes procyonoides]